MAKLQIKIAFLGYPPPNINLKIVKKWNSDLFEVLEPIENLTISNNADLEDWAFSDQNISEMLPVNHGGDIMVVVTSVPLENNFYARRLANNRLCITFFEVGDFLKKENIPLENFILRVLYSASIVYKRHEGRIPTTLQFSSFTHDETRGCVFDMNGIKNDIIYSTNKPIICDSCVYNLRADRVDGNLLVLIKKELKKIKKPLYYRIADLVKRYPVAAIILSSFTAIILGAIGSLVASWLWEAAIKKWFRF